MTKEEFLISDENKLIYLFGKECIMHLVYSDNFYDFKNDFKTHKYDILDSLKIEYDNASADIRKILIKKYVDYFLSFFVPKMYVKYFLHYEYKHILIMNKEIIIKHLLKEEEYEKIIIFNKIIG